MKQRRLDQDEAVLDVMEKLSAFFENAIQVSPDEPWSKKKCRGPIVLCAGCGSPPVTPLS